MKHLIVGLVVAAAAVSVTPVDIAGQTAPAKKPATAAGGVPRLRDGHPDLQGTYDLGTITPLERRAGSPLVLTDEDAKKGEQRVAAQSDKLNAPIDANRAAPPAGGTATSAATTISGSTRARNSPWWMGASAPRCWSIRRTAACRG